MEVFEAIMSRRSVRKYEAEPVPDELIEKILEAGRWAPTGGNLQPWKFIIVKDPKIVGMIRKVSPGYLGATPFAIVVCSDRERAYKIGGKLARDYLCIADCAMAVENMLLAAHALGLGACPVKSFSPVALKEILEIPTGIEPELVVIIGHPDKKPSRPPRFPLEEITYVNKYGEKWLKER